MKDLLTGKMPLFVTPEKALKKVLQERERGDVAKARKAAVEGLEKFPESYDLAIEAVRACLDLSDYPQAANLLKNAYKRHAARRAEIMDMALEAFKASFSTLIGSFIVETMLKSRNLEGIAEVLGASPEAFVNDLAKRAGTRAKNLVSEGQEHSTLYAENELLLGMLCKENKEYNQAVESLGRALELLPDNAQGIGALLAEIEQELPPNGLVKFYLGLASLHLAHPEKAEARFFQCLELEAAPFEKILSAIDSAQAPCPNKELLKGEIFIRSGKLSEGASVIRAHLWNGQTGGTAPQGDRLSLAEERLKALPPEMFSTPDVVFLYGDVAAALGLAKEAIAVLERASRSDPAIQPAVVEWLERNGEIANTAPAQNLLARLHVSLNNPEQAVRAARLAADMNGALLPGLLEMARDRVEHAGEVDPRLKALLAELYARSQDRTSAEEVFGALKRERALPDDELMKLSAEIMKYCGIFLTGVMSAIEISLGTGTVAESIPFAVALYREKQEEQEAFASSLRELAEEKEAYWPAMAQLVEALAKEETLSPPFRFLQAEAHLFTGGVERAVFEFDQLLMLNTDIRWRLIDIYKKASACTSENATLHLALYHLYLEEESLSEAAHHLCRTLELDPSQIRDVVARFEMLVEKEPENLGIWEEMLKTSLAMNRTSLAKEVLNRAIASLPKEKAAVLRVYGARISAADGRWEDALSCIALALTSAETDLPTIVEELRGIIARDPANPQAHFLLAQSLLKLGKEGDALPALRRCLELSPDFKCSIKEMLEGLLPLSVEPWLLCAILGELAWLDGAQEEAVRYFASAQKGPRESLAGLSSSLEKLRSQAPDDARLSLLYARNLALQKRYGEAVSTLEQLVAAEPRHTSAVIDILISIVTERPEQFEANRLLARIFVQSGDVAQSVQPLVRIMSDEKADPSAVDDVVAQYVPLHESNAEFLIQYGGLKARKGEMEEALSRYVQTFRREPRRSTAILAAIEGRVWPRDLVFRQRLLAIDCLIAERRNDEAFTLLRTFSPDDRTAVADALERLTKLIEEAPLREYFSLGASLLAQSGQIEEAERLITEGCSLVGANDAVDLTIELGEILYNAGQSERGTRLFAQALEASTSKGSILKRIEQTYGRWADREIERLEARLEAGQAAAQEIESLVNLAIERAGCEKALAIVGTCGLSGAERSALLGRVYLSMDRPLLACAALAASSASGAPSEARKREFLYTEGIARERAGDYGGAAADFAAIAAEDGEYADARERALRNYAKFLESQCEDEPLVLEKTTTT